MEILGIILLSISLVLLIILIVKGNSIKDTNNIDIFRNELKNESKENRTELAASLTENRKELAKGLDALTQKLEYKLSQIMFEWKSI